MSVECLSDNMWSLETVYVSKYVPTPYLEAIANATLFPGRYERRWGKCDKVLRI